MLFGTVNAAEESRKRVSRRAVGEGSLPFVLGFTFFSRLTKVLTPGF